MAVSTAIFPNGFTSVDSFSSLSRLVNDVQPPIPYRPTIFMADLNSDVFNLPLDRLCNLWVARYGNDWVPVSEVVKERFFELAYERLRSMGMLEMHYLTDRAHYVCRRPE